MTLDWHGDAMLARIAAGAMRGVTEGIGIVEKRAVELILETRKTGRIYRRRGVEHQASAPGEPPASDTGNLVNNRRIVLLNEQLAALLIFGALYAIYLQRGTSKMEPRPWADRALKETEPEVRAAIINHVRAAI